VAIRSLITSVRSRVPVAPVIFIFNVRRQVRDVTVNLYIGSLATNVLATVCIVGDPQILDLAHSHQRLWSQSDAACKCSQTTDIIFGYPLTFVAHQTCFWNNEILTPIQKHGMAGPGKPAFKKLKILLDRMMLRRTKVSSIHV
jgi:hypothetical protein